MIMMIVNMYDMSMPIVIKYVVYTFYCKQGCSEIVDCEQLCTEFDDYEPYDVIMILTFR